MLKPKLDPLAGLGPAACRWTATLRLFLCLLLVLGLQAPAHATPFVDTFINSVKYAKDEAYQAFMKIKIIEQIRIMKQNYDASVRYYREFQKLNQGKGILYNVAMQLKEGALDIGSDLRASIDRDFLNTYNTDTGVDRFFKSIDRSIANNMKYAGDELGNLIANRKIGVNIAKNADGLSPKDSANMGVKAQGIQIQMMALLHEDNLRLIQIQSMILANDTKRQLAEQALIEKVRKSVERISPEAAKAEEEAP